MWSNQHLAVRSAPQSTMDRHEKRHSKHHKDKHKKRTHKKSRTHTSGTNDQSYATCNSHKPLVEYSDVSSEALSAPEAGEIDSEASSISRRMADDRRRSRNTHPIRTLVDTVISVTNNTRRGTEDYTLTRDSLSAASRKRLGVEYEAPVEDSDEMRYKKKKDKRKKDKKKTKKKPRHRSASLESVSPDDNVPEVTPVRTSPQRYEKVPVSEWERPSSPLRNGSCSPVSPTTPPLLRHEHRLVHRAPMPTMHHSIAYEPHHRSPPIK